MSLGVVGDKSVDKRDVYAISFKHTHMSSLLSWLLAHQLEYTPANCSLPYSRNCQGVS